jgi:hypothetical protein
MSARATVKKGDLNRYLAAAKAYGFAVEIRGDVIRLLPTAPGSHLTSDDSAEEEAAWDKALGLQ